MEEQNIIMTSLQPWDLPIAGNAKNIAYEFSKKNRVLYANSPLDRVTQIRERDTDKVKERIAMRRGEKESLIKIKDDLYTFYPPSIIESIGQINSDTIFDALNKVNNKRFAKDIRSAADQICFREYVLFCDSDMYRSFYLKEYLNPKITIYYTRDNLVVVEYWKRHGTRIEPKFMKKADLVVGNSTYLTDLARDFNPNSYYIGQGCDFSLFNHENELPYPEDLKAIQGPKIGYIGYLTALRLDISVLEYMAENRPDWQMVLVGPEDDAFKNSKLHNIPNVHFLGLKKPDELPAYLNRFDVALNPQLMNELTIGNYPRKIDEYLALGKPVVATKTPAMNIFSDHTYLAQDKVEYVNMTEQALQDQTPDIETKRIEFALSHTWKNSVQGIYDAIKDARSDF